MAKNAIITGGSRGIGKAMALKLGEKGYKVVINYRSDSSKALTEEVIEEIKSEYGVEALAVQADVSKFEDCEKLVKEAIDFFGEEKIDALVNNAGITNNSNFIDLQPSAYEAVINTNLVSMMHMSHLCLPYMVDNGDASITCTASVGGMTGYCAAKTGVIGLVRALALEFAPRQVRVNAIAPGMIMTDMLRGVNQDELNALAATIPLGRIGDVSDIAGALDYILDATYLTFVLQ